MRVRNMPDLGRTLSGSAHLQRGLTLVELALGLCILGLCLSVALQALNSGLASASQVDALSYLDRADAAITAYAQIHGRLPCAASVTTGQEDCANPAGTYLPYITLGLADPAFATYSYQRGTTGLPLDGSDRYRVPWSNSSNSVDAVPDMALLSGVAPGSRDPGFNLCSALLASPASSTHMAYSIGESSADAATAQGQQQSQVQGIANAHPVHVSRAQLAARGNCGELATAGRAHYDLVIAAKLMQKGGQGNLEVIRNALPLTSIDLYQGQFFAANAYLGIARAAVVAKAAEAAWLASDKTQAYLLDAVYLAYAKAILSTAHAEALTSQLIRFSWATAETYKFKKRFEVLQADIEASENAILQNAQKSVQPIFVPSAQPQP